MIRRILLRAPKLSNIGTAELPIVKLIGHRQNALLLFEHLLKHQRIIASPAFVFVYTRFPHGQHKIVFRDKVADFDSKQFSSLSIKILDTSLENRPIEAFVFSNHKMGARVSHVNNLLHILPERIFGVRENFLEAILKRQRAHVARIIYSIKTFTLNEVSLQHKLPRIAKEESTSFNMIFYGRPVIELDGKQKRFLRLLDEPIIGILFARIHSCSFITPLPPSNVRNTPRDRTHSSVDMSTIPKFQLAVD